jgi:hypothetical protein
LKLGSALKLGCLVLGLGFLFWWGWSGNFIFNPASPFSFSSSEDYYVFSIGGKGMGYARRVVSADKPEIGMTISEESLVNLSVPGISGEIRLSSEVEYGPDGRPLKAMFTLPGLSLAKAEASVEKGFLTFQVNLGPLSRKIEKPVPKEGPVLISAVGPWLSRQSEVPLGKVLILRLFDPTKLDFVSGELIVTDVSDASDEIQIFLVSLKLPGGMVSEWLDANGRLIRQRMDNLEAGLDVIDLESPEREEARLRLSEEPKDLLGGIANKIPEQLPEIFKALPLDNFLGKDS